MRLIKPSFEIIDQAEGLDGINKQIELAGRTCYKSHDKITEGSAKKFVEMMKKSGHGSTLEHGAVYLALPMGTILPIGANCWGKYVYNNYSKGGKVCEVNGEKRVAISTNLRVLVENDWMEDLQYLCEPTQHHEKRITVKWHIDRVTGESFLRHRVFSFARESTRYCNYSKNKFGSNITCIIPTWSNLREGYYGYEMETDVETYGDPITKRGYLYSSKEIKTEEDANNAEFIDDGSTPFIEALTISETNYFALLNNGWQPQQARQVLPFSVYSPLVMTGYESGWKHFFKLRDDAHAHPDAQFLAHGLKEEFVKRGYLEE